MTHFTTTKVVALLLEKKMTSPSLTTINCQKFLIYRYKCEYLRDISSRFPLVPMISSSTSFWSDLQGQAWAQFCGAGLKFNWKAIEHLPTCHATTTPTGTSCLVDWHYRSKSSQLSKTFDGFSPSAAWIASSSIVNDSWQERSFQLKPSLISLHVLQPKCTVSSATWSYHLVLIEN